MSAGAMTAMSTAETTAPSWQAPLLAFVAGLVGPLAFSPVDWWPCGLLSLALLYHAIVDSRGRRTAFIAWCYGVGYFGAGSSWIYVSISVYGNAGPLLAGFITLLFVLAMALFIALPLWLWRRYATQRQHAAGFAASWVLGEWLRTWLFTGFPWLFAGSAHVDTPLAGIAPVFGVFGISFLLALTAALLVDRVRELLATGDAWRTLRHPAPALLALAWLLAWQGTRIEWTEATGERLSVGVVQGNIAQDLKFHPDYLQRTLDTYERLSEPLWDADLLIWPETAIPLALQQAGPVLDSLAARAARDGSTLMTGIFFADGQSIHNSVTVVGNGSGLWHKQKLVPFGEYVPLREVLSNLLQLFELPMSSLSPGPSGQALLQVQGHAVAPFVCYEIVYPDFVRRHGRDAAFLVTISNDTWFGASWGPWQHLQMARLRSLELGRYLVRATVDGVSALIDARGVVLAQSRQFTEDTLSGEVLLMSGRTPFGAWGSVPILLLSSLIFLGCWYPMTRVGRNTHNKNNNWQ